MHPIGNKIKYEISRRLPQENREDFDDAFDRFYEKLDDIGCSVGSRVNSLKYKGQELMFFHKNGFTSAEVWSFGDLITRRFANVCGFLYDAEYDKTPDYLDACLDAEHFFRAFDSLDDALMDAGHSDIVNYRNTFEIEEKVHDEQFMPKWMWVFDTLLNPDVYVAPKCSEDNIIVKMEHLVRPEISYEDVKKFPITESRRISKMMKMFADKCWGYSEGYAEGDKAFMSISERGGDKWKNGQSLAIGFLTHADKHWRNSVWKHENGFVSQKPREELGLDWVAWIEDVLHAGDVLALYADWLDDEPKEDTSSVQKTKHVHTQSLRDSMRLLDFEEAEKLEQEIMSETRKVWEWIGKIGRGFWD